jgi:outer membrane protein OmpA-like peptidoglycan-associated protein
MELGCENTVTAFTQLTSLTFIFGSSEMKATMIMGKHYSRISIILSSVNAYYTNVLTLKIVILGHTDSDISPNKLLNF